LLGNLLEDLSTLVAGVLNVADHEEGRLGEVVVLALEDLLERADSLLKNHKFKWDLGKKERETYGECYELAGVASEDLSSLEGLREELLDLAGTLDGELVLLRQLVHTEDSNDILERLVVLENLLDTGGGAVVLDTDDAGVEHARLAVEGIDGGVDAELGNLDVRVSATAPAIFFFCISSPGGKAQWWRPSEQKWWRGRGQSSHQRARRWPGPR